jgi:hypothetical protein
MTWNYRVIEHLDEKGYKWWGIHEVYYDEEGNLMGYIEDKNAMMFFDEGDDIGNCQESFSWTLDRMREALNKPVLLEEDFKP